MPGSLLPSRSSSEAPPPVEMWLNLAATSSPAALTAAALSPPPTTVNAPESAIALATASLGLMLVGLVSWMVLHQRWPEIGREN